MLRQMLEQRASIGQSWHVSQAPPGSIVRGYGDTYAGEDVDPEIALSVTAWIAGTRILGEGVSSLPLILYRRLKGGGKERAVDHPYYNLLHDAPNPEHPSMVFRELLQNSLVLCGNAYAQKVYNGAGRIIELWPLRGDRMRVERIGGRRVYHYLTARGAQRDFNAEEILHIPGFGFDGLVGYSLVYLARHAIALSIALEKYGSKFFANGAWPGIVLEHPKRLTQEAQDNLKDSFMESHGGTDQSHGVFIAEEGMKATQMDLSPETSQMVETRRFQVAEVARILRIPLAMLEEHTASATYASVEQFMLSYVNHTLRPWLVRWEQMLSLSLLTPAERKEIFFEHLIDGLLRGDAQGRATALNTQRNAGVLNADEWREIENRNPLPNGEGQIFWRPLNMANVDDQKRAFEPLFQEIANRITRREIHDLREAGRKFQKKPLEEWNAWLSAFYAEHREFIERAFQPAVEALAGALGQPVPDVRLLAADYAGRNLRSLQAVRELDDIDLSLTPFEKEFPYHLTTRAFALFEKDVQVVTEKP